MSLTSLTQRRIIITGASSGIGASTATALAERGARLALLARRTDMLHQVAHTLPGQHLLFPGDIAEPGIAEAATAGCLAAWGGIDTLIANVGAFIPGHLCSGDPAEWERGFRTNCFTLLRSIRAVVPHMIERKQGHIIIVASVAGRHVIPGQVVYCAAKHAVYAIADGLRRETIEHGLRVSIIAPGWVANSFWDRTHDPAVLADHQRAGRCITSDDISRGIVYCLEQPADVNVFDVCIEPRHQHH